MTRGRMEGGTGRIVGFAGVTALAVAAARP